MKLKFRIAKLEDVEEKYREFYVAGQDGQFYLSVEGAVAKERLDEFRDNNSTLQRRLEAFGNVDPAKIQEMIETQRKVEEKKLIDAGDIDGLVASRVATMKAEHDRITAQLNEQLSTSNRQLETLLIDNSVREQATKLGVAATAIDDVLLRAKTVYKVENGQPVAKDDKGQTIYGKDGTSSMPIGEWIGGLKERAPHLFGASAGSGSGNNNRGGQPDGAKLTPAQKIAQGMSSGSTILS